jgi:hypothetical protein
MSKKLTLTVLILLVGVVAFGLITHPEGKEGKDCIKGSGKLISEERTIGDFDRVKLSGGYELVLTQGTAPYLRIEAEDNILSHISSEVTNGQLEINMKDKICSMKDITIYLTAVTLKELESSGAIEVKGTNKITAEDFSLRISGAGEVNIELETGQLNSSISGAGELNLRGKAKNHKVKISGAGELDASDLRVGKYDLNLSGASDCEINVEEELVVNASGASSIAYRGNPSRVEKSSSGASSIRKVD